MLNNVLALQEYLTGSRIATRFIVRAGPAGSHQSVAIAQTDMTQLQADAYVVPQFRNVVSTGGVAGAIIRAGAREGMARYGDYLARKVAVARLPDWGEVLTVESGGGQSRHLMHAVTVQSGNKVTEGEAISKAVGNSVVEANRLGLRRVIFPALGTGVLGELVGGESARLILGGLWALWEDYPDVSLSQVIIAIHPGDTMRLYESFSGVLDAGVTTRAAWSIDADRRRVFDEGAFQAEQRRRRETTSLMREFILNRR